MWLEQEKKRRSGRKQSSRFIKTIWFDRFIREALKCPNESVKIAASNLKERVVIWNGNHERMQIERNETTSSSAGPGCGRAAGSGWWRRSVEHDESFDKSDLHSLVAASNCDAKIQRRQQIKIEWQWSEYCFEFCCWIAKPEETKRSRQQRSSSATDDNFGICSIESNTNTMIWMCERTSNEYQVKVSRLRMRSELVKLICRIDRSRCRPAFVQINSKEANKWWVARLAFKQQRRKCWIRKKKKKVGMDRDDETPIKKEEEVQDEVNKNKVKMMNKKNQQVTGKSIYMSETCIWLNEVGQTNVERWWRCG